MFTLYFAQQLYLLDPEVRIGLWRGLKPSYYRVQAIILMYDVTNRTSFVDDLRHLSAKASGISSS